MRDTMASIPWRFTPGISETIVPARDDRTGYGLLEEVSFDYSDARSIVLTAKNHGVCSGRGIREEERRFGVIGRLQTCGDERLIGSPIIV